MSNDLFNSLSTAFPTTVHAAVIHDRDLVPADPDPPVDRLLEAAQAIDVHVQLKLRPTAAHRLTPPRDVLLVLQVVNPFLLPTHLLNEFANDLNIPVTTVYLFRQFQSSPPYENILGVTLYLQEFEWVLVRKIQMHFVFEDRTVFELHEHFVDTLEAYLIDSVSVDGREWGREQNLFGLQHLDGHTQDHVVAGLYLVFGGDSDFISALVNVCHALIDCLLQVLLLHYFFENIVHAQ